MNENLINQIQVIAGYVLTEWDGKNLAVLHCSEYTSAYDLLKRRFEEFLHEVEYDEDLTYCDEIDARIVTYDGKRYAWHIAQISTTFDRLEFDGPNEIIEPLNYIGENIFE